MSIHTAAERRRDNILDRLDAVEGTLAGSMTAEDVQDNIGGILVDTSTIDLTYSDAVPSISAVVIDGSITPAKLSLTYVINGGALGTPSGGTLTNCTGLPQTGVTSLVSDLALKAPLASPTFTGTVTLPSGQALIAPALGTPASCVATNFTGTAASMTAGTVTTNANLTGDVTSSGNATTIGAAKVTDAMRANRAALSVWGRSANSIGVGADIAAPANGQFLTRVASVVGFNGLNNATPVNTLGLDKLVNASATARVMLRVTSGAGAWEEGTAANLVTVMGGKQTVTGSKVSGAALASLLAAMVALGLITDSTTA